MTLLPPGAERRRLLEQLSAEIDSLFERLPELPVVPRVTVAELRGHLSTYDLEHGAPAGQVLSDSVRMLTDWNLHSAHPRCFGLFNPTPAFMGVVGDALAAAFNPQLAVWSHSPVSAEIERHLIRYMGARFGLPGDRVAGHFTTGGAEANLTGVLLALTRTFPEYGRHGLRSLPGSPVFYASAESHLAWLKIAHLCGLGREAVRLVPVEPNLQMDLAALADQVAADRAAGLLPFLVVATAGTTSAGVIDPLLELADFCAARGLRFHVDAAWGGAAALSDRLRGLLAGIERADSITFDAHKWLSVPMGGGIFLCTDQAGLHETFRVSTAYMPPSQEDVADPYVHSVQWSRRFIGLKLFLTLATVGRQGYAQTIESQTDLGTLLRRSLEARGWKVVNQTPLPVVCWQDPAVPFPPGSPEAARHYAAIVERVAAGGKAWISATRVRGEVALRACVTSYRSNDSDIALLMEELEAARQTGLRRPPAEEQPTNG